MHKLATSAVAVLIVASSALPASALNTRTWISGTGVDQAGCGGIASPCRTLQYAHDNTNPKGEIDIKDSAGYGAVAINRAISIISDGAFGGVLAQGSGNGISINVGASDIVILRGLTIEGGGVGTTGISMASGGILNVSKCIVQNFIHRGIEIAPASGQVKATIEDTDTSYNGWQGIAFFGRSSSDRLYILNAVTKYNTLDGIRLDGPPAASPLATISNTSAINNGEYGIYIADPFNALIDNVTVTGNVNGIGMVGGTFVLGRSAVFGNKTTGVNLANADTAISYKNNQINANGTDIANGSFTIGPLQ